MNMRTEIVKSASRMADIKPAWDLFVGAWRTKHFPELWLDRRLVAIAAGKRYVAAVPRALLGR